MNIFPNVWSKPLTLEESINSDYNVISNQMGKIPNKIYVNKELLSEKWWTFLKEKYSITNESNVITKIDITVDEDDRTQYIYKYYVKIDNYLYFVFFDEKKDIDDDDYYEYATEDDKADKITALHIFFDPDNYSTEKVEKTIIDPILKMVYQPLRKNQFFSLGMGSGGFELNSTYLNIFDVDLEMNYGIEFSKIHEKMIDKLNNEDYGLSVLYGSKGSGKTTYIRRLISDIGEDNTIIYIPSHMQDMVASTDFMSFISKFKDSILILEDAELTFSKNGENKKALTNILNLIDSILSDNLCIKVIMVFNTSEKNTISPELFRTSKLIIDHKFNKLHADKANAICEHLGYEKRYTEAVLIGEIYEGCNQIKYIEERKVGFK